MRCFALCFPAVAALAVAALAQEPVPSPPQPTSELLYVGAEACKPCHADIYARWAKTGHERAFRRMSGDDQQRAECLTCHVTGTADQIAQERDSASHPGVQCERCHGPGRHHAENAGTAPPALEGVRRAPGEDVCLGCHNDKSPRFRGFVFRAMVGFVHK